jgi:hypothetical protein
VVQYSSCWCGVFTVLDHKEYEEAYEEVCKETYTLDYERRLAMKRLMTLRMTLFQISNNWSEREKEIIITNFICS